MKTFNKTDLATVIFASCTPFAMAVMTDSAGTLNGTIPVLKASAGGADHSVTFTNDHANSINGMAPGDKITLSYLLQDAEGDTDGSTATIKWFTTTDGVSAGKVALSNDGKADYTIQAADAGRYLGAEIIEQTSTGVPTTGQTITIADVSKNDNTDNITDGPIVGGSIGTAIVDSTAPTVNLIGKANSVLKVGHTYQFQVWYDVNSNGVKDAGELDASANYGYKWVFAGTSATTGTAGGNAVSSTDNKDLTIPLTNVDAKNILATAGADGVQGYSLKVDYTAKVKAVLKSVTRK